MPGGSIFSFAVSPGTQTGSCTGSCTCGGTWPKFCLAPTCLSQSRTDSKTLTSSKSTAPDSSPWTVPYETPIRTGILHSSSNNGPFPALSDTGKTALRTRCTALGSLCCKSPNSFRFRAVLNPSIIQNYTVSKCPWLGKY